MLKNYMEVFVEDILPIVLKDYEQICKCPKCIEDIKAISLNHLKPLYVVTKQGEAYAKINEMQMQFKADIIKEIVRAIEIVSKNPKHDSPLLKS